MTPYKGFSILTRKAQKRRWGRESVNVSPALGRRTKTFIPTLAAVQRLLFQPDDNTKGSKAPLGPGIC